MFSLLLRRWVVSEYSACSKECGNGVQTRQVQCIHEVARGPENALTIAHGHCPQPAPTSTQQCSLAECPARWEAGPWRKCSRHCGSGIKSRSVKCVRELSLGQVIEVPAGHCPAHRQPHLRKVCNKRHCKKLGPHEPLILPADNGVYVQKEPLSRLSIKVGGRAIVFAGTTLKIRCPRTRSANKTHDLKVDWYRDGHKIASSKKYQQTARHALRVRHIGISDSGRYTCSLGASEASILVTVRPPPSSSSVASSTGIEPARMPGDTFDNKANPWDTSQRANGTVDRFSSGPDDDYEENKLATHDDDHDDGHIDEPVYLRGEGSLTTDQPVGQTWDSYGHQERAAQGSYYASDQRTPSGEFDSDFDGDLYASYSSSTTESAITVSSTSSFYYFTVNANSVTDYTADPVYVNNARSRGYQRQPAMSQLRAYLTQLTSSFMGHIGDNVDSPDKLIAETNNNSDHNMADTSQATGDKMPWICHRHCLSPPLPHHRCVILCH
ncbi:ADAMTS-like protein 1 [Halotydeus destructor]|nr:ADAMTS-like protein 1 [Halotydeus destructor]